jgi:hypothetical protein
LGQGKIPAPTIVILRVEALEMAKRICWISMFVAVALLSLRLPVSAQEKSSIYQVQITNDTSGLRVTPCPLPGISGDTWRFHNSTSDTIYLSILMCVGKQDFPFYFLAAGDSVDHIISMWDAALRAIIPRTGEFVPCYREYPPSCPALTSWGIIVVVGLITSSTIFIMLRRRNTTASV